MTIAVRASGGIGGPGRDGAGDGVPVAPTAQQQEAAQRRPESQRDPGEQDREQAQDRELQRLLPVVRQDARGHEVREAAVWARASTARRVRGRVATVRVDGSGRSLGDRAAARRGRRARAAGRVRRPSRRRHRRPPNRRRASGPARACARRTTGWAALERRRIDANGSMLAPMSRSAHGVVGHGAVSRTRARQLQRGSRARRGGGSWSR